MAKEFRREVADELGRVRAGRAPGVRLPGRIEPDLAGADRHGVVLVMTFDLPAQDDADLEALVQVQGEWPRVWVSAHSAPERMAINGQLGLLPKSHPQRRRGGEGTAEMASSEVSTAFTGFLRRRLHALCVCAVNVSCTGVARSAAGRTVTAVPRPQGRDGGPPPAGLVPRDKSSMAC